MADAIMQDDVNQQPQHDELTEIQNSLLQYLRAITTSISEISIASGTLQKVGEHDMSQSIQEKERLQMAEVFQPISNEQIEANSREVIKNYQKLLGCIKNLSEDYDKDENELIMEVKSLEEKNLASLRAYRDVYQQTQSAKESLVKVVDTLNNI